MGQADLTCLASSRTFSFPVHQVAARVIDTRSQPAIRKFDGRSFSVTAAADIPRVMPETACVSSM